MQGYMRNVFLLDSILIAVCLTNQTVLLQLVPVGWDFKPWFRLHMTLAVGGTLIHIFVAAGRLGDTHEMV